MIVLSPAEWDECRRKWGDDPETWMAKFLAEWWRKVKSMRIKKEGVDAPDTPDRDGPEEEL